MGYIKICPLTAFPLLPHPPRVSPSRAPVRFSPTISKCLLRRLGMIRNDSEVQNTNVLHSRVSQLDNASTITYIISDK